MHYDNLFHGRFAPPPRPVTKPVSHRQQKSIPDVEVLDVSSGDTSEIIILKNRVPSETIHHKFFINEGISTEEDWYLPLIKALTGLNDNDNRNVVQTHVIDIYLNTYGGQVRVANQLISLIRDCQSRINVVVNGVCCSAGTTILFGVIDLPHVSVDIEDDTEFLFHTMRTFDFGKINDIEDNVEHSKQSMIRICEKYYTKVLTEKEIQAIQEGKELWMFGDEVKRRLNNRIDGKYNPFGKPTPAHLDEVKESVTVTKAKEKADTRKTKRTMKVTL